MATDEENTNILDNTTDADVLGKKYKFPLSRNEILELMTFARQDEARKIFARLNKVVAKYDCAIHLDDEDYEKLKKKFGVSSSSDDKPPASRKVE